MKRTNVKARKKMKNIFLYSLFFRLCCIYNREYMYDKPTYFILFILFFSGCVVFIVVNICMKSSHISFSLFFPGCVVLVVLNICMKRPHIYLSSFFILGSVVFAIVLYYTWLRRCKKTTTQKKISKDMEKMKKEDIKKNNDNKKNSNEATFTPHLGL